MFSLGWISTYSLVRQSLCVPVAVLFVLVDGLQGIRQEATVAASWLGSVLMLGQPNLTPPDLAQNIGLRD
jgi:hypothetical protein